MGLNGFGKMIREARSVRTRLHPCRKLPDESGLSPAGDLRSSLRLGRNVAKLKMDQGSDWHILPVHAARIVFGLEQRINRGLLQRRPLAVDHLWVGGISLFADGEDNIASAVVLG